MTQTAAQLVVKCLEAQGVKYIFGIPGAKIDAVFNALEDSSIQLIVCRHEQNAVFMAAAHGRLTGEPGVVLVTSGPGIANMTTGLLTATTEGDPVIALGGNVPREMLLKASHQSADNVQLMKAATKLSVQVMTANSIPETIENAFRTATAMRRGACFISLPQDVLMEKTDAQPIACVENARYNQAPQDLIKKAASLIDRAQLPVLLLGAEASRSENTKAIRALLKAHPLPVVGTYQAAGVISRNLEYCFVGRVGLFRNQPGDILLEKADVIVTVGFDPVEYDPEVWHANGKSQIIHIDYPAADIRLAYQPKYELLGDIAETVTALSANLTRSDKLPDISDVKKLHDDLYAEIESGKNLSGERIHPLRFIYELRQTVDDETIVICDVGSVYMWMARYFLSYEPHHLLFSNGQQTLGVGLPWAISANFLFPNKQIISISGDGGFLFSAMELETAVREKRNFVHFVWSDGCYNMVMEQEVMKYKRESGVELGPVNLVDFAKAFGAKGFELKSADQFQDILNEAIKIQGPVLINVPIDYSNNADLFSQTNPYAGN